MELEKLIEQSGLTEEELKTSIKQLSTPKKIVNLHNHPWSNYHTRIGIISDTHIGSKYFNYQLFDESIKTFNREKVDAIYHSGDVIEGMSNRDGHIYELETLGTTNQISQASDILSQYKQPLFFITGNHDEWSKVKANQGVLVGPELESKMPNSKFLGEYTANIKLGNNTIMRLTHEGNSAYALSYSLQKRINALEGGTKPDILINGHLHKMLYMNYRNIHAFEAACFCPQVEIITKEGKKKICHIKVGDEVLTHKRRFRKVTAIMKRKHYGKMVRLFTRKNDLKSAIQATEDHPVLSISGNQKVWKKIKDIKEGDTIFILNGNCASCGKAIPHYNKFCNNCTPMHLFENREKLSVMKGKKIRDYTHKGTGWQHLEKDILPYCRKLNNEGWRAIPVGCGTIPDIVAFKDEKVKLIELESCRGFGLDSKKKKYDNSPIKEFCNQIEWIDLNDKFKNATQNEYEIDEETGFIKVKVVQKKISILGKNKAVYNFEVEEDNSYIASNVVVHNCIQNQTPFMAMKGSPAMLGYYVLDIFMNKKNGDIKQLGIKAFPGYK